MAALKWTPQWRGHAGGHAGCIKTGKSANTRLAEEKVPTLFDSQKITFAEEKSKELMPWKGHGSWISRFQRPKKNQYEQLGGSEKVNG